MCANANVLCSLFVKEDYFIHLVLNYEKSYQTNVLPPLPTSRAPALDHIATRPLWRGQALLVSLQLPGRPHCKSVWLAKRFFFVGGTLE